MSNTTHNNENTESINSIHNNNNNNNTRTNGTQACAACKYQRRKCASDCLLAPYFPHHLHHEFLNAHKLFGVSNITKIIRPLPQPQKDQAMFTIKYESNNRAADPVGGTCRIIRNLQHQIEFAYAELDLVMQQLAICRAAAADDTVSIMCDPDPQTQPHVAGTESKDVTIHCGDIITNNIENHASDAYKDVYEATSPLCQQPQPQVVGDESKDVKLHCHNVINNNGDDHESNVYKAVHGDTSLLCQQTQTQPQAEEEDNVTVQCDSMINSNPEDQLYLQDLWHLDENNEEEEIEEYFLEEGDVNNDDNNNNVILSLQDMEASWDMRDALAYCLHDKEGFVDECKDFKPNGLDMGGERLGLKYYNDEPQIFEHSDKAVSKDNKVILQEETASCISKDEKPIVKEDFVTVEDAPTLI